MNCAYHARNAAVVGCNGCGKPLCPACDHRIKGFPYCQDCIVSGVELLRNRDNSKYVPFVKRQTSPFIATILSFVCPGLGAAYNGQTSKALVYFAVFVALFQLAILTGGTAIFVLGFIGMWFFAMLDSWRTAQLIRSGITPDGAEDLLVKRISGNPKLWGIALAILGALFFLLVFFDARFLRRAILPILFIGLGIYLLRGFMFKKYKEKTRDSFGQAAAPNFVEGYGETSFRTGEFETDYKRQSKAWKTK
ncbi:MAG: hypothetical protein ACR2N3_18730 [Pyrinomonadaceae bacterium]